MPRSGRRNAGSHAKFRAQVHSAQSATDNGLRTPCDGLRPAPASVQLLALMRIVERGQARESFDSSAQVCSMLCSRDGARIAAECAGPAWRLSENMTSRASQRRCAWIVGARDLARRVARSHRITPCQQRINTGSAAGVHAVLTPLSARLFTRRVLQKRWEV